MRSPKRWVSEMWANFDVSRLSWFGPSWNALRGMFTESFFKKPVMEGSVVNYDLARSMYRNQAESFKFGGGFVRPIIDLTVEYMGIPSVSGTEADAFLNECITDYWAPQLQEMLRDAMRDSKVLVRYRQPNLLNPLMAEADRMHGRIDVIPPEEIDLTFDPTDCDLVIRAAITHFYELDERTQEEVVQGIAPRRVTHEIVEVITQTAYTYYDKTAGTVLESWATPNTWGFVPIWPVFNEYAADLGGGQSDIEPVLTFIEAFHDVMEQTLAAHKYHSTPKAKFKVKDMKQFIKNNWPDVLDEQGNVKQGAKINWSGKEIMFFQGDEDAEFLEARDVLGNSKTLLQFIIDCICISSETPRWAILAEETPTSQTDASVQPFVKKISRKRVQFQHAFQMICRMALVATGKTPAQARIAWPLVRLDDLAAKGQAIQQLILGFDVATQHQWLSDRTVVHILSTLFDEVSDPDAEMKAAKDNLVVEAAPAPPSDTSGLQVPQPSNGKTSPATAKKALATTAASRS